MNKFMRSLFSLAGIIYFSNANAQPSPSFSSPSKKNIVKIITNEDLNTPLFPLEYYDVKKASELMRKYKDLIGKPYTKTDVYVEVYVAGKPFVFHSYKDSLIEAFNNRKLPLNKKAIKIAEKDERFSESPYESAYFLGFCASLEYKINRSLEAQTITKK